MIVHIASHVPFEGPAMIAGLLAERGHQPVPVALHAGEPLPPPDEVAAWISMGGPMSANDHDRYPWVGGEQELMRGVHAARRPLLGVCLGAQQIGAALGARVLPSPNPEIGWYPIEAAPAWTRWLAAEPEGSVLHWHGEMVTLPDGARPVGSTPGCPLQGFFYPDRPTCGLQFHLEMDARAAGLIVDNGGEDLTAHRGAPWVQDPELIRSVAPERESANRQLLSALLQRLGL